MELFLAWKSLPQQERLTALRSSGEKAVTTMRPRSGGASRISYQQRVVEKESTRPRSASATRRLSTTASKTVGKPSSPPRKIVIKFMLKQQKEARKINMENKKLQEVLQHHAVKGSTAAAVYQSGAVDAAPKTASKVPSVAESKATAANRNLRDDKEATRLNTLKATYDELKRTNAELESNIASLKAKLNNLGIQAHKARGTIERSKLSGDSALAKVLDNVSASVAIVDEDNGDLEYQQLKVEYDVLQSLRKGFVERIMRAKEMTVSASNNQEAVQREHEVLAQRILSLREEFPSLIINASDLPGSSYEDDTTVLYTQLMATQGDLHELEALRRYDCGQDVSFLSNRRELDAMYGFLDSRIRELREEVQHLRSQQDSGQSATPAATSSPSDLQ